MSVKGSTSAGSEGCGGRGGAALGAGGGGAAATGGRGAACGGGTGGAGGLGGTGGGGDGATGGRRASGGGGGAPCPPAGGMPGGGTWGGGTCGPRAAACGGGDGGAGGLAASAGAPHSPQNLLPAPTAAPQRPHTRGALIRGTPSGHDGSDASPHTHGQWTRAAGGPPRPLHCRCAARAVKRHKNFAGRCKGGTRRLAAGDAAVAVPHHLDVNHLEALSSPPQGGGKPESK